MALDGPTLDPGVVAKAMVLRPFAPPTGALPSGGDSGIEELLDRGAQLLDLAVGDVERVEDLGLGDAVGAALDHQDRLVCAGDDQVKVEPRKALLGGVDDEIAVVGKRIGTIYERCSNTQRIFATRSTPPTPLSLSTA